jgi:hypothetical protein
MYFFFAGMKLNEVIEIARMIVVNFVKTKLMIVMKHLTDEWLFPRVGQGVGGITGLLLI